MRGQGNIWTVAVSRGPDVWCGALSVPAGRFVERQCEGGGFGRCTTVGVCARVVCVGLCDFRGGVDTDECQFRDHIHAVTVFENDWLTSS